MKLMTVPPTDLKHYAWQFSTAETQTIEMSTAVMKAHGFDKNFPLSGRREKRGRSLKYVLTSHADRLRCEAAIRAEIARVPIVITATARTQKETELSGYTVSQHAWQHAQQEVTEMAAMDSQTAKNLYRHFLRAVHPDKYDTSQMTEVERTNWQLMLNGFSAILKSVHRDIANHERWATESLDTELLAQLDTYLPDTFQSAEEIVDIALNADLETLLAIGPTDNETFVTRAHPLGDFFGKGIPDVLLEVDCQPANGYSALSGKRPFQWKGDAREVSFHVNGCEMHLVPLTEADKQYGFQDTLPPGHALDTPVNVYRYVIHALTEIDIEPLCHRQLDSDALRQQWALLLKRLAEQGFGNTKRLSMIFGQHLRKQGGIYHATL